MPKRSYEISIKYCCPNCGVGFSGYVTPNQFECPDCGTCFYINVPGMQVVGPGKPPIREPK